MKNWIVLILVLVTFIGGANFWRIQWSKNSKPPPDLQLLERLNQALQQPESLDLSTEDFRKLEAFIQMNPDSREFRLLHARIVWRIAGLEDRISAKKHLFTLGQEKDEISLQALHELTFTPIREGVSKEDIVQAATKLMQHPLATTQRCLQAGDVILFYNEPEKSSEIIQGLIKKARFSHRSALVKLLFRNNLYPHIVELLQPEEIPSNMGYYFPLLISFLEMEKIDQAQQLLDSNKKTLKPADVVKSQAYLAKANGKENPASVYIHWAKSQNSMQDLAQATQFALLWGNVPTAIENFKYIFERDPKHLSDEQCGQFLNLSLRSRKTAQALQVMEVLHKRFSNQPASLNNLLWLKLLNEKNPAQLPTLLEQVEDLVDSSSDQQNFFSTLALAHLLLDEADKAKEALHKRGKSNLQPGERALWAASLAASGEMNEALKYAHDLEEHQLLPDEWALLQKFYDTRQ